MFRWCSGQDVYTTSSSILCDETAVLANQRLCSHAPIDFGSGARRQLARAPQIRFKGLSLGGDRVQGDARILTAGFLWKAQARG